MTLSLGDKGPTRRIFGKLERTETAARRKLPLAEVNGWGFLKVEPVRLAGEEFWQVTGIPMQRNLEALHGIRPGVSAPRGSNSKFRKDQRYRW